MEIKKFPCSDAAPICRFGQTWAVSTIHVAFFKAKLIPEKEFITRIARTVCLCVHFVFVCRDRIWREHVTLPKFLDRLHISCTLALHTTYVIHQGKAMSYQLPPFTQWEKDWVKIGFLVFLKNIMLKQLRILPK